MFSQYEPNVNATIAFLKSLGVKVNDATVNETLQNHPNWPSLLCISDSLQSWNIPNAAGKVQQDDIDRLPTPFIACTQDPKTPMPIVTQVTNTHIDYYSPGLKKSIHLERENFLKNWAGVYLIAEANKESGEQNFKKKKRTVLLQTSIPIFLFLGIITLSFFGLQSAYPAKANAALYIQYSTYVAGIFISSLLLWYEVDRNNPLLKKICTGLSKGSCETVLTSSKAKLLSWISWSEVGFFYFTGGLFTLLLVPGAIHLLAFLSLLAMPYIVFSIYYQGRVVKRWCTLCLAVQALLLLGGINTLAGPLLQPFALPTDALLKGVGCFLLPVLGWYSFKPWCLRLQQATTLRREYLRLKFNTEIFNALLKNQKPVSLPATSLGIDLGRADAGNTLIKVCNPYCGPCASAHVKLEKLLEKHDNLRVKIIFTATGKDDDIKTKPVKHLMAITEKQNEEFTKKALDDWYHSETKDYDAFAVQYPMNGELPRQDHKLEAMASWCHKMDVIATPTIFLNGYQLPDVYNIDDLEYFLLA